MPRQDGVLIVEHMDLWTGPSSADDQVHARRGGASSPTWKLLHEHQVKDDAGRVTGYTGLEKVGQTLAPIMIRRRKSEVLRQLPSRTA